jgi:hypothetical protein
VNGPFTARRGFVVDRDDQLVLLTGADTPPEWAEQVAADLNYAARLADLKNLDVTLAMHMRDDGKTIRASVEACASLTPAEIHAAIARAAAPKATHLRAVERVTP